MSGKPFADPLTLVDRLRGIYTIPVNDGAGLLHGKDTYTQTFEVPPINLEAADEIERLRADFAGLKRERSHRQAMHEALYDGSLASQISAALKADGTGREWEENWQTQSLDAARDAGRSYSKAKAKLSFLGDGVIVRGPTPAERDEYGRLWRLQDLAQAAHDYLTVYEVADPRSNLETFHVQRAFRLLGEAVDRQMDAAAARDQEADLG